MPYGNTHSSSSRSTTTTYYSSTGGGQPQTNKTCTVTTYIDGDGKKTTETNTTDQPFSSIGDPYSNINSSNNRSSFPKRYPLARNNQINDTMYGSNKKRYSSGWGSSRKPSITHQDKYIDQARKFTDINRDLKASGQLFEDKEFLAVDQSIFYSHKLPRRFEWKRPHEICKNPKLFVGGASRFDVKQGELGDCWLLAAVSSLCGHKDLLHRVVPPDQSLDPKQGYCGMVRFNFWQYGEWVEIIVDDRLPTYNGKLVFMHSAQNEEFWTSLLEKAYAKLVGSYEALKGGATSEAMEDFTGGVTEVFDFRNAIPNNIWQIMKHAYHRQSLLGCSIEARPGEMEAELSNGLIIGHAYSITCVKMVEVSTNNKTGKIPMLRIRNPWGNDCEWKGAWSDKSPEWKFISEEERLRIGLTFTDDGEFWMSFKDFTKNFQKLEICNLGPDSMSSASITTVDSIDCENVPKKKWEQTNQIGSWKKHVNAGGCRNFLETFWTNPQYRVHVVDPDEGDQDNCGTLIVALMQKDRRKKRKEGVSLLTIGYCIYKLKDPNCGPLDLQFFKYNASVAKAPAFINLREVCGRHKLPPGHYCIVPTTFEPGEEADFLLRLFSEKPNTSEEIDEATSIAKKEYISDIFFGLVSCNPPADVKTTYNARRRSTHYYIEEYDKLLDAEPYDEFIISMSKETAVGDDVTETANLKAAFMKLAGDDEEIDAYELMNILNTSLKKEFKFDGFTEDTCRGMVATMDADRSGKLDFGEFKSLWNDTKLWKAVFKKFDNDNSGTFNSFELRQALRSTGFTVSNATFNTLVMRYARRDGTMNFDDYLRCVIRLKTMFAVYKDACGDDGKPKFNLDQFIQTTMYA